MSKRPAYQWYPGDFRRDAALQACSFESRGLWREMLDLMHDGDPYGHLSAGGLAITPDQLARMVGVSLPKTKRWLAELEARKVFSRTAAGIIYSRRMVKDEELRALRQEVGKLGGNPKLKLHAAGSDLVNQRVNREVKAKVNQSVADAVAVGSLQSAETTNPPNPPAANRNGGGISAERKSGDSEKAEALTLIAELRSHRVRTPTPSGIRYHIPKSIIEGLPARARKALAVVGGASAIAEADDTALRVLRSQFAIVYTSEGGSARGAEGNAGTAESARERLG